MDIQARILREEANFPRLFASCEERPWGLLFHDAENPESHDGNHAVLHPESIADFGRTIEEITAFYLGKEPVPRIYQPPVRGYFAQRREILEKSGYRLEIYGDNSFMLLSAENAIPPQNRLTLRRLAAWDDRIATDLYLPAEEAYMVHAEKKSLQNANYYLFAGFLGEEMAVLVSLHTADCTRFDYRHHRTKRGRGSVMNFWQIVLAKTEGLAALIRVFLQVRDDGNSYAYEFEALCGGAFILTAPRHRGKGYAKEALGFAVDYCRARRFPDCFQWPAHAASERICEEAGFRRLFSVEAASAIYGAN